MEKIKINSGGINHSIEYKTNCKFYSRPLIVNEFIEGETGELWYELDNGRQTSAAVYESQWLPQKRKVMPVWYKGENKDGRKIK